MKLRALTEAVPTVPFVSSREHHQGCCGYAGIVQRVQAGYKKGLSARARREPDRREYRRGVAIGAAVDGRSQPAARPRLPPRMHVRELLICGCASQPPARR
jgi:hypothetical protein